MTFLKGECARGCRSKHNPVRIGWICGSAHSKGSNHLPMSEVKTAVLLQCVDLRRHFHGKGVAQNMSEVETAVVQ